MRPAQLVLSRTGWMWLLKRISSEGGDGAQLAHLVLPEEQSCATRTSS